MEIGIQTIAWSKTANFEDNVFGSEIVQLLLVIELMTNGLYFPARVLMCFQIEPVSNLGFNILVNSSKQRAFANFFSLVNNAFCFLYFIRFSLHMLFQNSLQANCFWSLNSFSFRFHQEDSYNNFCFFLRVEWINWLKCVLF